MARNNTLKLWEVQLVKAMLASKNFENDQTILAYFTRPTRSVNHRAIAEIRTEQKHTRAKVASMETLEAYLKSWPFVDPDTGLHILDDELVLKSREAMLAAVQVFNNPKSHFRAEIFIVNAVIAWTYLLHAHYKKIGLDYRYKTICDGQEEVRKTRHGADMHWMLEDCLKSESCPVELGAKNNLMFLIKIRHEIEHQMTNRIDEYISAKLQACAINFSECIVALFGKKLGLAKCLSIAIQFSGIDLEQAKNLPDNHNIPKNIEALMAEFEGRLSEEEYNDPKYAHRVIYVRKLVNNKKTADQVIEFIGPDSDAAKAINNVVVKEVSKNRYLASAIVRIMNQEGYANFKMGAHTRLWQERDAKNEEKQYGITGDYKGGWVWHDSWLEVVREHCASNTAIYREA